MAVIHNNYTNYVNGTDYNDQIYNYVTAYVHGRDGNDEVTNIAQIAFINGDDDSDIVVNYAGYGQVYMDGGEDNDYLANYGSGEATLYGGYDVEDYNEDSDILIGSSYAVDTFLVGEYCGYDVIYNYDSNDRINCATSGYYPVTPTVQGNDVIITGAAMYVVVKDVVGKQFNFTQTPSYGSMIFDTAEDVDENLWGIKSYVASEGAENIFVSRADGSDLIFGAAQDDTIQLYDTTLSEIVSTSANENSVTVNFATGKVAIVETSENISPTFKLTSGESYVYNRETNSWQEK